MPDLKVLEAMGSTQARLKEIFTAVGPSPDEAALMDDEQKEALEETIKIRQRFEEDITFRFSEQVYYMLKNWQMYSAVDLAWDAAPVNKVTVPLMLYAGGKIDVGACAKSIEGLPDSARYIRKDDKGNVTSIDTPQFYEVNFNLVRSVISRRHAAQVNKYAALYPHYKYEARSTSTVAKLKADVVSQVMDIMTDAYDLRHHDMQCARDAMLYGHCVDFVRSSWEEECQYVFDDSTNPDLKIEGDLGVKKEVAKEGIGWVNPHPTRVFWDNAYPISSINSDTGCQYVGFWDIVRYGDVANNTQYWNRTNIGYSVGFINLFSNYANYFSQYYCTINPPCNQPGTNDLSASNDRLNNLGLYAQNQNGSSMLQANYFRKIVPKDHGIGDYPFPVWMRMLICGTNTVVHAEFLPSSPACYMGINENDSRQLNISIAMELMPYQDQLSQLLSLLLITIQACNVKVMAIDIDGAEPAMVKRMREDINGKNRYSMIHVWEYSGNKMKELGVEPRKIVELIQTQPSQAVPQIFEAISKLIQLAERLMALSPQELGQPAPREISATETTLIAGTTETMYGFISEAIDEFRSAKKRILYEGWMACGSPNLRVPVIHRYTKKTIAKAGFKVEDEDGDEATYVDEETPRQFTITGSKSALRYDYIYTSRDGALRSVNTQAANAMVQLLGVIKDPVFLQQIPKEKLFDIINEIFRLSGTGVDLLLEVDANDPNQMGPDKQAQIEGVLQQLTANAEQERQQVGQLDQKFEQLLEMVKELTAQVQEIDAKASGPMIDPLKESQTRQKMLLDQQSADLDMTAKEQQMIQDAQAHELDMRLKEAKAASETAQAA